MSDQPLPHFVLTMFRSQRCSECGNAFPLRTDHVPGSPQCDVDRIERQLQRRS